MNDVLRDADRASLAELNPEPRLPCVVLVDTSGSMAGDSISELNNGLRVLREELLKDPLVCQRVELAVVRFGGGVEVVQNFVSPAQFEPPILTPYGGTPMGGGIVKAFELTADRQRQLEAADLDSYGPWILMVTDGESTDSPEIMEAVTKVIREADRRPRQQRIAFFAVGVENANMEKLAQLSVRSPARLQGFKYAALFRWLSQSVGGVSRSRVGDPVQLPRIDSWAEV